MNTLATVVPMVPMRILVREAVPDDLESAQAVIARALQSLRTVYRPARHLLEASDARASERRQLVAVCDGEIRGSVFYEASGDDVHLQALAVDPEWQRRGVARALVAHAAALARA